MTLFTRSLKIGALLLSSTAALLAFEGRIDMQIGTPKKGKEPFVLHYLIKGKLMRTETPMGKKKHHREEKRKKEDSSKPRSIEGAQKEEEEQEMMVGILDFEKWEMTTIMDEQRMYMVHKLPAEVKKQAEKGENPFKPTGRKERIAGIEAEEYAGQTGKSWTEIWVTKELGRVMMSGGRPGEKSNPWDAFLSSENFFSLRTITRNKQGGEETMHMEAIKVEKESLPDSLFSPPAGYSKMEMPGLGGMLRGLAP